MKHIRIFVVYLISVAVIAGLSPGCYTPEANSTDLDRERRDRLEFSNTSTEVKESDNTSTDDANTMTESSNTQPRKVAGFRNNLLEHIGRHGYSVSDVVDESSPVERRLLDEYGAVFLSKALPPAKVMFTSEAEVSGFQAKAGFSKANLNGITVELQPDAATALLAAANEARSSGKNITPNDPKDAARRSYAQTFTLWNGRFISGCQHWLKAKRLTEEKVNSLKNLPIKQQVSEVLGLESQGIYFSTNFDKSILYSVAAPGTSQHLSMLAFDAKEFKDASVRAILANHGWFRTVKSDAPHFTYLGYSESELPSLGLKKVTTGDGEFWIPSV